MSDKERISFGDWCDMKGILPTMGQVDAYVRELFAEECRAQAPQPDQFAEALADLLQSMEEFRQGALSPGKLRIAMQKANDLLKGTSEQAPQELELEQEVDGRWIAELLGVAAYGHSKEEAIRNAAKVLIESTPEQASYPNDPSLMCAEGRHKECIGSNQPWWVCGCACHKKASEQASPSTGVSLDGGKTIHSKFKND